MLLQQVKDFPYFVNREVLRFDNELIRYKSHPSSHFTGLTGLIKSIIATTSLIMNQKLGAESEPLHRPPSRLVIIQTKSKHFLKFFFFFSFTSIGKLRGMHAMMNVAVDKLAAYFDKAVQELNGEVNIKEVITGFTIDVVSRKRRIKQSH